MTELTDNFASTQALALLTCYGFELKGYPASILIYKWLKQYRPNWIHLAVVEALYQGRYKAISVEHILDCWQRRGQPNFHFSHEFERLICQDLPQVRLLSDIEVKSSLDTLLPGLLEAEATSKNLESETISATPAKLKTSSKLEGNTAQFTEFVGEGKQKQQEIQEDKEKENRAYPSSVGLERKERHRTNKSSKNRRSIQQFTPLLDNSALYSKLRTFAHQELQLKY